jgi:hypothetical protein
MTGSGRITLEQANDAVGGRGNGKRVPETKISVPIRHRKRIFEVAKYTVLSLFVIDRLVYLWNFPLTKRWIPSAGCSCWDLRIRIDVPA